MSTKKNINKASITKKVAEVKAKANQVNDFALKTTEELVTEGIEMASQWQKVTETALKGGVKLLDNQQELIFSTLEAYKKHFVKGKDRLRKVFA